MEVDVRQKLADLVARGEKEKKRFHARRPKAVGNVIATVVSKRGYAASKAADELDLSWKAVVKQVLKEDELAKQTSAKGVSRGVLEVLVTNHVVMQEINFHRPQLLEAAQQAMPNARIKSIRFKVSRI